MLESIPDEQNANGKKRVKNSVHHFEQQRERITSYVEVKWTELQNIERKICSI